MTSRRLWRLLLVVMAFMAASFGMAHAQGVLPVPALTARVIDQTGTLTAPQRQSLDAKLAAFEQKKGSQIVVLMVPTTAPEDIASYANRVGNAWKIGRKDVGDGVLLIVAKDDRKMRIEVAKTLEGAVPDLAASRIIDGAMMPRFRENDFAGGIDAAVDQIIGLVNGEPLPEVATSPVDHGSATAVGNFDWQQLGIFMFFGVVLVGRLARSIFGSKLGPVVTGVGAGVIAMLVTSSIALAVIAGIVALVLTPFLSLMSLASLASSGRSGYGGRSSGGGGGAFSSGGGGNFGGGGASGGW